MTVPWLKIAAAFLLAALGEYMASVVASAPLWRLRADAHWTERARRSWGLRSVLSSGPTMLFGMSLVIFGAWEKSEETGLSYVIIPLALFAGAIFGSLPHLRRLGEETVSSTVALGDYAIAFLVRTPAVLVLLMMLALLVPRWLDSGSVAIMAVSFALSLALTLGLGLPCAQAVGLLTAAPARLEKVVAETCALQGYPLPRVFVLHWRWANAMAFSFAPVIAFTPASLRLLSDEELAAICAHELAHRQETRAQKLVRLSGLLVIFPAFTLPVWAKEFGAPGIIIPLAFFAVGTRFLRGFSQRMEKRADQAAHGVSEDPAVFAGALEKCYRFNMVPAVMRGKRHTHPHLYDRLIAAGIQPSYPRPEAPSVFPGIAGLIMLTAVSLAPFFLWMHWEPVRAGKNGHHLRASHLRPRSQPVTKPPR